MSKLDEKIAQYQEENKKLNLGLDDEFIAKVTKALGPSIYKADTEIVSCSSKDELERVKKNFLIKKLGLDKDDEYLDSLLKKVCEKMGKSNRKKYRALFYALLAKETNKESVYN
ncbi:DUF2853 family protein [Caminibacter mediatlanticus TB-2]|uniref:DUF2853 family protein n=1 Tax=Caminibacter mediatlanticus TB-2 TaxID=391592 RepID=A0AAI9F2X7_9BACT|nr:DUF2853 family protein [Caminibacter mediatlanticus]EDM24051.1 hypothetical protein CMTB2_07346 [Caminibacter mediatlanticus TB-2]QCT94412.1 DUF2853 family protein [Caminibacter mediatlanticus TB-2]